MIHMCNWLGFYDLADMLEGVRGPDVYVLATSEHVPIGDGTNGYAVTSLIVSAYDRHAEGQVRYWSLRLGTLTTVGGHPMSLDKHRKLARTSRGAEESMREYLRTLGFNPVRAAIARPVGFQYLDSDMSTVGYDEDTNEFTFGARR
jgi:hypothetical protein